MEREWRVISWAHNYEVSNYGEVRRVDTKRYLTPTKVKCGNLNVTVMADEYGKHTVRTVASLVAEMFLEKPDNLTGEILVIHKDRNKLNNRADNLMYISRTDFVKTM